MTQHPALQRLDRLEGFLREDPDNLALRADAFDTALQGGDWARAEVHLRHGERHDPVPWSWRLREGQWLLAQGRRDEARAHLHTLADNPSAPAGIRPVVAHDLAFIALRDGAPDAGLLELAPWVGDDLHRPLDPSLQMLWLRLLHHAHRIDEAMAWSRARAQAHTLATPAAGVAALVALDANDFASALAWSDQSLQAPGAPLEAFVARASVALARDEADLGRALLERAMALNPNDGRVLSALGYTELLARRLDVARAVLTRAVEAIPQHVGTWHALGWTCLLQNDLDAARAAFEQAVALDRNFAESHGGLAVVLAVRNERDAAADAIRRAKGLDRNTLSGRYAQAVLDGEARNADALHPLAARLLGDRPAPFGGSLLELLFSRPLASEVGQGNNERDRSQ